MSSGPLSFSPLPDVQNPSNYNSNSTSDSYNTPAGNFYGGGNAQFPVPIPPIPAWGGNSQIIQEQQYNVSVYAYFYVDLITSPTDAQQ